MTGAGSGIRTSIQSGWGNRAGDYSVYATVTGTGERAAFRTPACLCETERMFALSLAALIAYAVAIALLGGWRSGDTVADELGGPRRLGPLVGTLGATVIVGETPGTLDWLAAAAVVTAIASALLPRRAPGP